MSEREEVGSSTILRIACSRIQRLTLKAWCVAYRENESARVEKYAYMLDKSILILGGGEGRLPWRSGSSITSGKAGQWRSCRIKGLLTLMLALGLAGITCLSGTTAMSLWNEWHSCFQEQGPASAFNLKGSKTPGGKNAQSALLNRKSAAIRSQEPGQ